MKKITLILIILATFATKSFAYCPIPQWCPKADLHQTLCPGDTIDPIEFPSVIAKTLIVTWWTDETRTNFMLTPPPGITVSGDASNPLGEREYAWPVSIKGTPTTPGTHHYTVSNTCGVELLHGSITLNAPIPATPGTITFSPTSVCVGDTLTASISAVNGADFYTWTTPESMTDDGSDTTTLTITDAGTTSGNLAVSVTATNSCGTSVARTQNITVNSPPTIGDVTPSDDRGEGLGVTFIPALTLTANPAGTPTPTIQWYSNLADSNGGGTSMGSTNGAQTNTFTPPSNVVDTVGKYYYAEVTNVCGSEKSSVSGKHTVHPTGCNTRLSRDAFTTGGNPYFKTNRTWTTGTGTPDERVWSDVVLSPYCKASASQYTAGVATNNATDVIRWGNSDCVRNLETGLSGPRPNFTQTGGTFSAYYGDLFSWCMVSCFQNLLCSSGWRVPTAADFQALIAGVANDQAGGAWLRSVWGGALTGYVWGTALDIQHQGGFYWSLTETPGSPSGFANALIFVQIELDNFKGGGYALRCVR